MAFNHNEVNFLIYRYLVESGFTHTSFTFGFESDVGRSNIDGTRVPPGALINIILKGIYYTGAELSATEDGVSNEIIENLSLIDAVMPKGNTTTAASTRRNNSADSNVKLPPEKCTVLKGHGAEAFTCPWNPISDILATGSGDSTARMWDMTKNAVNPTSVILKHCVQKDGIEVPSYKDVTSVDWNCDGTLLATGSYDGFARIWNLDGTISSTLGKHKGPIFVLKWNPVGKYILSAGVDKSCIVWDTTSNQCRQQFQFHTGAALDIDWQSNTCFASCSADKSILVCSLGTTKPVKCFTGHTGEINAVKWNPYKNLLGSCSDDKTLKIWSLNQNTYVRNFGGHTKEIYTLRWNPDTSYVNSMIASASFDSTIRLWDVEHDALLHTLARHTESVYSIAFSPNGKFIASGSFDSYIYIWSTMTGQLIRSWKAERGIFDVCWNKNGTRLSASSGDGQIYVLDLQQL